MLCAALSNPEGQRGPWQNTRHRLACIAGLQPEGKGAADPFCLLCQHQNFEFDTSSRRYEQRDACISSVCAQLYVQESNKEGTKELRCNDNVQVGRVNFLFRW